MELYDKRRELRHEKYASLDSRANLQKAGRPEANNESPPILKADVEETVRSLKVGKSPGVDNVPSELIKYGEEAKTASLTALCQNIWEEKNLPNEWTLSLVKPLPKNGNLKMFENYRTISLISHPSKVMLRIILYGLKTKAEELLAEKQAGLRAGRSTVEQKTHLQFKIR